MENNGIKVTEATAHFIDALRSFADAENSFQLGLTRIMEEEEADKRFDTMADDFGAVLDHLQEYLSQSIWFQVNRTDVRNEI